MYGAKRAVKEGIDSRIDFLVSRARYNANGNYDVFKRNLDRIIRAGENMKSAYEQRGVKGKIDKLFRREADITKNIPYGKRQRNGERERQYYRMVDNALQNELNKLAPKIEVQHYTAAAKGGSVG